MRRPGGHSIRCRVPAGTEGLPHRSLTRGGREAAAPYNRALEEGLGLLGWVDGRNVVFEHRYADLKPERYPELAADLVRRGVDVVVAPSTPAALALRPEA